MLLSTERIKSSLVLTVMQASNSNCGFESLLLRHSVCEPSLRGPEPWRKGPISGLILAENNHHAPQKLPLDLAHPAYFGAYSLGHDGRVVVSEDVDKTLTHLRRT